MRSTSPKRKMKRDIQRQALNGRTRCSGSVDVNDAAFDRIVRIGRTVVTRKLPPFDALQCAEYVHQSVSAKKRTRIET